MDDGRKHAAAQCILFSGAAQGAEAAFGAAAERHGLEEVISPLRATTPRGRAACGLDRGGVAAGRCQPGVREPADAPHVPRHPPVQESAAVHLAPSQPWPRNLCRGAVPEEDGTVKGGTGWGAEFAELCNKPLFVFAQDQEHWCHWTGEAWEEGAPTDHPPPVHRHRHAFFTGERAAGHQRAVRALVSLAWTSRCKRRLRKRVRQR